MKRATLIKHILEDGTVCYINPLFFVQASKQLNGTYVVQLHGTVLKMNATEFNKILHHFDIFIDPFERGN